MTPEQAEKFRYNILDLTKVWPHAEFPLRPFGKIVLDKNVDNYFAEIEQVCQLSYLLLAYAQPRHKDRFQVTTCSDTRLRVCSPLVVPAT